MGDLGEGVGGPHWSGPLPLGWHGRSGRNTQNLQPQLAKAPSAG